MAMGRDVRPMGALDRGRPREGEGMEEEEVRKDRVFGAGSRIRRRDIEEAVGPLVEAMNDEDDAVRYVYLQGALAGLYFQYVDDDAETFGDGLVEYLRNSWLNFSLDTVLRSARSAAEELGSRVIELTITRKGDPDGR